MTGTDEWIEITLIYLVELFVSHRFMLIYMSMALISATLSFDDLPMISRLTLLLCHLVIFPFFYCYCYLKHIPEISELRYFFYCVTIYHKNLHK